MKDEEKLLTLLAEKYRASKKDMGTSKTARGTFVSPKAIYPAYGKNSADPALMDSVNETIRHAAGMGFVTFDEVPFSNEIRRVRLVDQEIERVEAYLAGHYGYEPKASKRNRAEQLIQRYGRLPDAPAARAECQRLQHELDMGKIPAGLDEEEDLLKALCFVETNDRFLFLREASMEIYGDSKYLEEKMLISLCRHLMSINTDISQPDQFDVPASMFQDEILERYHIFRERQKLRLKGPLSICMSGKWVDLEPFSQGIEFSSDDLPFIEDMKSSADSVMTIENKVSFERMPSDPNGSASSRILLYLGGYCTRYQRDFIRMLHAYMPQLTFEHFGDIDAGGLYIHDHLCRVTGLDFELFHMSVRDLTNPSYQPYLKPLTAQDRIRLTSLKDHILSSEEGSRLRQYDPLVQTMLAAGVKLEQEIISLNLAKSD